MICPERFSEDVEEEDEDVRHQVGLTLSHALSGFRVRSVLQQTKLRTFLGPN